MKSVFCFRRTSHGFTIIIGGNTFDFCKDSIHFRNHEIMSDEMRSSIDVHFCRQEDLFSEVVNSLHLTRKQANWNWMLTSGDQPYFRRVML